MARKSSWARRLAAALSIGYLRAGALLPLPALRLVTRALARIAYVLVPRMRRVGRANLDLAYGDGMTPAEKRRVLRGALDNMAIVAAEFAHMPRLARRRFAGQVVLKGFEHIDLDRGGVFIGAHFGNWELTGPAFGVHGYRIAEIVRPLDDPGLDAAVDAIRRSGAIDTLPKDDAGRELMRRLRDGEFVGILIDQSPRDNALPVTFFDAPCWATAAPALAALRARLPIYPIAMRRGPQGLYTLELFPPIPMTRTGDLRADMLTYTQRCQDAIEEIVRAHPEQWLWFHRRWKARPRLEAEWRARAKKGAVAPAPADIAR